MARVGPIDRIAHRSMSPVAPDPQRLGDTAVGHLSAVRRIFDLRPIDIGSSEVNMALEDSILGHSLFLGAYPFHTHSMA